MLVWLRILFICLLCILCNGCALLATGKYQTISIVSSEPSSEVTINGEFADSTPCEVKVLRSRKHVPTVEVYKRGFHTENVKLRKRINPHVYLNLINLPGWFIDIYSGAAVRYQQPDTVILRPKKKK